MLLCSDMGGYSIAMELAEYEAIGYYNGLVVAAIMGATFTFLMPLALIMLDRSDRKILIAGVLSGICCIPVGCLGGGVSACVILLTAIGIFEQVTGISLPFLAEMAQTDAATGLTGLDMGLLTCGRIGIVLAGAFPMIRWISKVCKRPLGKLGKKLNINEYSVAGFLAGATNYAAGFGCFKDMDIKGKYLNTAFLVSGGAVLGDLLGFTAGINSDLLIPMIVGKMSAGIASVLLANWMRQRSFPNFLRIV